MIRCAPTGMLWSSSPNTNQLGTVCHSACCPAGSNNASWVTGRWVIAIRAACSAGRSAQNWAWYLSWAM